MPCAYPHGMNALQIIPGETGLRERLRHFGFFLESLTDGDFPAAIREHSAAGLAPARVGMPATVVVGSDRYPARVVEVSKSGLAIVIERERRHGSTYVPTGRTERATLRADGRFRVSVSRRYATPVLLGVRESYRDPSF